MEPVTTVEGHAYPFGVKNVDTDMIIAAKWLKTISRSGLGKGAFEALRQQQDNGFVVSRYCGSPMVSGGESFVWGAGLGDGGGAVHGQRPNYKAQITNHKMKQPTPTLSRPKAV